MVKLVTPSEITIRAFVSEDEIRARLLAEMLDQANARGPDGKPLPGLKYSVRRGSHGGYSLELTGAAPRCFGLLPPPE